MRAAPFPGPGAQGLTAGHSGVKGGLTPGAAPKRCMRVVENDEFARFVARVVAAQARRIAGGDVEGLRDLRTLSASVNAAIGDAVDGLRAEGYSWSEIGDRLGVTRQAAQQRWGCTSGTGVAS